VGYFREHEARSVIRETYGQVQSAGAAVAEALYSLDELGALPREAIELALGVGHPVRHAAPCAGEVVLDLGCGAGIDTLLAARRVGPAGRAIGLDMTPEMVGRARRNAAAAGLENVEIHEGLMEALPLGDASVDVVVSNGVLNLATRKSRVLAEAFRVLRPGGRIAIVDLVLDEALPADVLKSPAALAG
jgi:ubiquinone/menaquinone biosynthesis C-methylase UbiE